MIIEEVYAGKNFGVVFAEETVFIFGKSEFGEVGKIP